MIPDTLFATGQGLVTPSGPSPIDRLVQGATPVVLDSGTPSLVLFLQPWDLGDQEGDVDTTVSTDLEFANSDEVQHTLELQIELVRVIPALVLGTRSISIDLASGDATRMIVCTRFVRSVSDFAPFITPPQVRWVFDTPPVGCTVTIRSTELDFWRPPTGSVVVFNP